MTDALNYHRHLDAVAAADVAYVRDKDAKYLASWKQRGGVGAYFTIVRPLDRFQNMLDPTRVHGDQREAPMAAWRDVPIPAYDLFAGIRAEGLSGEDGTLIACVRDLRRYLLLVEAEMTEQLSKPLLNKPSALAQMDYADIEARVVAWMKREADSGEDLEDIYGKIADEMGVPRSQAKLKILRALYGEKSKIDTIEDPAPHDPDWDVEQYLRRPGTKLGSESASPPGTPEDGGHHALDASWPWVASWGLISRLGPECWDAWSRRGQALVLEHRLTPTQHGALPTEVQLLYSPVFTLKDQPLRDEVLYCDQAGDRRAPIAFWLAIEEAPAEERDRWRTLAIEQNLKEWQGLMEYGELYEWHQVPQKMILRETRQGWAPK